MQAPGRRLHSLSWLLFTVKKTTTVPALTASALKHPQDLQSRGAGGPAARACCVCPAPRFFLLSFFKQMPWSVLQAPCLCPLPAAAHLPAHGQVGRGHLGTAPTLCWGWEQGKEPALPPGPGHPVPRGGGADTEGWGRLSLPLHPSRPARPPWLGFQSRQLGTLYPTSSVSKMRHNPLTWSPVLISSFVSCEIR